MAGEAAAYLESIEVDPTPTALGQLQIFAECMRIYHQRNSKYGDLWRDYGIEDHLVHIRSKQARLQRSLEDMNLFEKEDLDSGYDLINYAAFLIRKLVESGPNP